MNATNQNQPTNNKQQTVKYFLFTLLITSFIFAYFPVWKRLIFTWYSAEEYSHGFFIIPLCSYIIWRKKDLLTEIQIKSSWYWLFLIIFSLLLYIFGHFAKIMTLASISMILLMAGMVIFLFGFHIFKELVFPLFLLLFMVPIPLQIYASLTVPLQLFVSKLSVAMLSLLGLPIYREGNIIQLPDKFFQVVDACSGLRSIISLLIFSALFGYFTLRSNFLRTILFFLGIPIAIFVNFIRLLLIVLAYYYFNYDLSTGTIHTMIGMIIFMIALALIFVIKKVISIWDRSTTLK